MNISTYGILIKLNNKLIIYIDPRILDDTFSLPHVNVYKQLFIQMRDT